MDKNTEDKIEQIRETVVENVELAKSAAQAGTEELQKQAKDFAANAGDKLAAARVQAEKAIEGTSRLITEHPLSAVAAAVTIGALAAWAMPKRAKADKAEKLADTIVKKAPVSSKTARQMKDKVSEKAKYAFQEAGHLTEQATEAARKASGTIAETASDVATRLSEKIQDIAAATKNKG